MAPLAPLATPMTSFTLLARFTGGWARIPMSRVYFGPQWEKLQNDVTLTIKMLIILLFYVSFFKKRNYPCRPLPSLNLDHIRVADNFKDYI